MNEQKQLARLWITENLRLAISIFALRNRCSWNQAATVLLERGLEVQSSETELDDHDAAATDRLAEIALRLKQYGDGQISRADIEWLIGEVKQLRLRKLNTATTFAHCAKSATN